MGIIDRIILSLYTLLLSLLSLAVVLLSLRVISLDHVLFIFPYIYDQWTATLAGAIFFLVSVRLLMAGLRSRRIKDTIVHHNELGDVHITIAAVENLVEKVARHIRGIRDIKVKVLFRDQGIGVKIKAVTGLETNVPVTAAEIQQRVHEYIKNTVGIEVAGIEVLVENISNDIKQRQRVE
ncbi:MAG TPA: alkaline shock response membrane anchor protein AmaP [Patescibacteria group bacterium]|nr:alkaline shock response membrane anchor protein AmaP [Patescibacteria group bacterium]